MTRPFRLGAGAGYAGDRIEPARDLAERGQLDALVFECLAERTIALAQLARLRDPGAGFDPLLAERLRAVLPACLRHGTRIVTNMGAAHPVAAGRAALQLARELDLPRLGVAVVTGDDVLPWLHENDVPLLDDIGGARTSAALAGRLVSANAYLGAEALLPALRTGADVVITGRVADPALFLAPLMHHHGWAADAWPLLGRGIAVGHLLECAAQVSGGYIAQPGHFDVPRLEEVGFPLAEVDAQGDAVITKLEGSGGRVDRLTCTAQLLYEIEHPARYLQPDVTADFSQVRLREVGVDRVAVSGASGSERPLHLKASLGVRDGFIGEGQISYAGPGARARGELALGVLAHRLRGAGLGALEQRAELIGVNAMHGAASASSGTPGSEPYEVRLRLAARCATRGQAERIGREVEALYLNGPAGGGGVTQSVREVLAVASCLVPRAAVRPQVQLLEWVR
ncbi:MAG: DUF1446 domain-containing protein [Rubrivivax sp.]|nr:DUF1446 domain-containing protein [Rubrivivax sp.]